MICAGEKLSQGLRVGPEPVHEGLHNTGLGPVPLQASSGGSRPSDRVVHLVHLIARLNDGGPARVIAGLGAECVRRGHRVTVLTGSCAGEPDIAAQVAASGCTVIRVPGLGRAVSPADDLRAAAMILWRLSRLRPDLVHTHTAKAGMLGRIACRLLGLPCLHTYHGHVLSGYFAPVVSRLVAWTERWVAGPAHHHSLTPALVRELAVTQRIGRRTRWHCLPVPVPAVTRRPAAWQRTLLPGRPVVGFLGRLVAIKDGDLWLETLAELASQLPVQGLICGDGPERARLAAKAHHLGLPVLFTGFVPGAEALAAMEVLIITSRNEGQPLVAVEAASVAVPVVATRVGGLVDCERWGLVAGAERTPAALAAAALPLLTDAPARRQRITRAAACARRLTPAALTPAYERIYQQVAG
jgi:glycosyltransferase involved in cell wall biosynthesis